LSLELTRTMDKLQFHDFLEERIIKKGDLLELEATDVNGKGLFDCKGTSEAISVNIICNDEKDMKNIVLAQ
jgi:hypothetical protein